MHLQICPCARAHVHEHSFSSALCMSGKNSMELRPRGTFEVFNVVKQVQRDRKGSAARAGRLVTFWPAHPRTGSAVGGDVSFSLSPPIVSLVSPSVCRSRSLTQTHCSSSLTIFSHYTNISVCLRCPANDCVLILWRNFLNTFTRKWRFNSWMDRTGIHRKYHNVVQGKDDSLTFCWGAGRRQIYKLTIDHE